MTQYGYGSAGDVLTSNGSGVLPSFQAASGGSGDSFLAILSATQTNATGDATTLQVPYDTIVIDTASGFTTGASAHYTFPTTGNWFITSTITYNTADGTSGYILVNDLIATSNTFRNISAIIPATGSYFTILSTSIVAVTAGDTLLVNALVLGGAKNVSVLGSGGSPGIQLTTISGYFISA